MAVYEISATTTVAASPEQVWAVLDDFSGWTDWMPAMNNLHVDHLTAGPPRRGYRFRLRGRIARAELEVTSYQPMERATRFRLNVPPLTGDNRCRLEPLGNGKYRIVRSDRLNLPGPVVKFLDSTQRERFERLAVEFVLALKKATENKTPAEQRPAEQRPAEQRTKNRE